MKVHSLLVSISIAQLEEQLDLEIWSSHTLPAIRTHQLIVWSKAQVTAASYAKA